MEIPTAKIILNVGGVRYETKSSTLTAFPGTKLCGLTEPQASAEYDYNPNTKEFFFDRSGRLFGQVLNYCRSKHLHCPAEVCWSVLEEELAFWEVTGTQLASCCWTNLSKREGQGEEEFHVWDVSEQGDSQDQAERRNGRWWARWRPRLWDLFDKPYSSRYATCLAILSLLFTISLIILLHLESKGFVVFVIQNYTTDGHQSYYPHFPTVSSYKVAPYLLRLELCFILWFTFEFFIRLTSCPDIKKFLRNPLNVVDFLSLFPVYLELFLGGHSQEANPLAWWLGLSRVLYVIKLLKMLKLVQTPLMMRVLLYMFRSILREMLILMVVFVFEILFFGTLCYFGELAAYHPNMQYDNIDSALWWSVITLTVVGYGDVLPLSLFGRVVAGCAAVCGVLTLIVPIPIFLIKFKGCYDAALSKEKRKKAERERTLPS